MQSQMQSPVCRSSRVTPSKARKSQLSHKRRLLRNRLPSHSFKCLKFFIGMCWNARPRWILCILCIIFRGLVDTLKDECLFCTTAHRQPWRPCLICDQGSVELQATSALSHFGMNILTRFLTAAHLSFIALTVLNPAMNSRCSRKNTSAEWRSSI